LTANEPIDLVEIEALPHGQLAPSVIPDGGWGTCTRCGRVAVKGPRVLRILPDVPADVDVFRLSDLTTFVLVTERFVNAIDAVGGARANFEPVEIE
jgi:hypothetical protein